MPEHSPGPLRAVLNGRGLNGAEEWIVCSAEGFVAEIAMVRGCNARADAALFAAAPDLLEALGDLYAMVLRAGYPMDEQVRRVEAAQAAIAKATGEEVTA